METKAPVKVADVAMLAAPLDTIELPLTREERLAGLKTGPIVPVRPFDGIGYDLCLLIEESPNEHGHRIWELVQGVLPDDVEFARIKRLTPPECAVITQIASGRIALVHALAKKMEGNVEAPVTTAEQEPPRSSTLSDSSASASGANAEEISST